MIDSDANEALIFGRAPPTPAESETDVRYRRYASWAWYDPGLQATVGGNYDQLRPGTYGGRDMVVDDPRNTVGRDFVVGDIHGMFPKLKEMLAALAFEPTRDRLFSVGDLVDRGSESEAAAAWIAEPWFFAVRGNHDQRRVDRHLSPTEGEEFERADGNGTLAAALATLPFMREIETDGGRVGIVHGDVPEDRTWAQFRQALIDGDWVDTQVAISSYRSTAAWPVRGDIHRVLVGHDACHEPEVSGNVLNIDTGAYKPDLFTIVQIQPGPWRLFQYPTWDDDPPHWRSQSNEFRPGELRERAVPAMTDALSPAVLRIAGWEHPYFGLLHHEHWWRGETGEHLVEAHEANAAGRDFVLGPTYECEVAVERLLQRAGFDPDNDRLFTIEVGDRLTPTALARQQCQWCHAVRQDQTMLEGEDDFGEEVPERPTWQKHLRSRPLVLRVETTRGTVAILSGCPPPDRDWDGWRQGLLAVDWIDCQMAHLGPPPRDSVWWGQYAFAGYEPPPRDPSVPGVWRTVHAGSDMETNPPSGAWGNSLALAERMKWVDSYDRHRHVRFAQIHPGAWRMWSVRVPRPRDRYERRDVRPGERYGDPDPMQEPITEQVEAMAEVS